MQVPCGRCVACRRRKQNEWAFRCLEEAKSSKFVYWVTLTYDDDHLVYGSSDQATLVPDDLTKFFKRLRKRISFRYFACGEYGDSFDRPHYHFILFTNELVCSSSDYVDSIIRDCWRFGSVVDVSPFIGAPQAKYVAKYTVKQIGLDYSDVVLPFARMSRRPGIGYQFMTKDLQDRYQRSMDFTVYDYQGTPYPLPRFYKDYFFSKDQQSLHSSLIEKSIYYKEKRLLYEHSNDPFRGNYWKWNSRRLLSFEERFYKTLRVTQKRALLPLSGSSLFNHYQNQDIMPDYSFDL